MELYIIRHGETPWNVDRRLQGSSDIDLNEYGVELARITSEALKDVKFDEIYSSPLIRAYHTAEIIKGNRNITIKTDERLREMCFGIYEGVPASERPGDFDNFFNAPEKYKAPENGESYDHLLSRAKSFIDEVVLTKAASIDRMLIVAHGALNKALMVNLNHQTVKDFWSGIFQHNCCVNIYNIDDNGIELIQNGKIYYTLDEKR